MLCGGERRAPILTTKQRYTNHTQCGGPAQKGSSHTVDAHHPVRAAAKGRKHIQIETYIGGRHDAACPRFTSCYLTVMSHTRSHGF